MSTTDNTNNYTVGQDTTVAAVATNNNASVTVAKQIPSQVDTLLSTAHNNVINTGTTAAIINGSSSTTITTDTIRNDDEYSGVAELSSANRR